MAYDRQKTFFSINDRITPSLGGCSSIGRASAFQAECRGFEPLHPLSRPPLEALLLWGFLFAGASFATGPTLKSKTSVLRPGLTVAQTEGEPTAIGLT